MKTPNDILNKRFSTATVVMLMVVLLVAGVIFGTMKNTDAKAANEEQFEFYLTYINALEAEHPYTGSNHIPLEDFQSCLEDWDGYKYFTVELYASALTASQYDVGIIAGVLTYDKSVFSLPTAEGYIQSAQTKSGKSMVDDWNVTLYSSNSDTVGDLVVFSHTADKQLAQDRLIATISFEILDPDAELNYDTCISYDFDPAYWENQTLLSMAGGDYYYYNSVESDDWSNITCTPLYIGELPGAEPSADLASLSLKADGVEYITAEAFDPAVTAYTTWQIPYATSLNGLTLSYTKASSSAEVSVEFSGSATIDENNVIRNLVDGEVITLNVSDSDGAITNSYTITASVTSASTNADLRSLIAKTGNTVVDFTEPFHKDTLTYTVNIPYIKTELTILAEKDDNFATLKIDNTVGTSKTFTNLPVGTTTRTVVVTAQSGDTKTYTVNIVRAAASDNTALASIKVNDNDVEITEGSTGFSYLLPETAATYLVQITGAEPALQQVEYAIGEGSFVTINANGGTTGSPRSIAKNETVTVRIRVSAEDRSVVENYTLTISRAPSTNTDLDYVKVTEGATTKTLEAVNNTYTYTIGTSGATQLQVSLATITGEGATAKIFDSNNQEVISGIISIAGIAAGTYSYSIIVTPQDPNTDPEIYTLNIIKKSSAKMLDTPVVYHVNGGGAEISGVTYEPATFTYSMNIPYAIDGVVVSQIQIVFTASPNSDITAAGITLGNGTSPGGGVPLKYSNNTFSTTGQATLTATIRVTAEDGSVQDYNINFRREAADSNTYLSSLSVGGTALENFVKTTEKYDTPIILEGTTTSVFVQGEAESLTSTITYNESASGQISLVRGELTLVEIKVTAQSGATRIYRIYLIAANTDNSITNIEILNTDDSVIPGISFDPSTAGPYNLSVPYTVSVIKIRVTTPSGANSIVTGDGTKTLNQGVNPFTVYATSEAGVKGTQYTINVTRNAARSEKILSSLTISSAEVSNYITGFSSGVTSYSIRVDRSVTSLRVEATVPENNGSRIISGLTESFAVSADTSAIYIVVEAENGSTQTYTVNVRRANDISTITDIEITDVQNFVFSQAITTYNLNPVSYNVTTMTLSVTLGDAAFGKLYVNGAIQSSPTNFTVSLATGENTINLYAQSDYGTNGTLYKIKVTRNAASKNARLGSLTVVAGGSNILTGDNEFHPDTILYEVRVNNNISSVTITPTPEDSNATVSVSPKNFTLSSGLNTYTVTVTAEDTSVTQDYVIKIWRANDVNEISNIEIDGQEFTYNKNTLTYNLSAVTYATTQLSFHVTLLDSSAKLYVKPQGGSYAQVTSPSDFNVSLLQGANTIKLYAVSEFGTQGQEYVFTVERQAPSGNAKLSALEVMVGATDILSGLFDPDTTTYSVRVDHSVTSLTAINTSTQSTVANAVITPLNLNLKSGENTFTVTVTAENGTTKFYEINVTRANDINDIDDVVIAGQTFVFDPEITTYSLTEVGYNISALNFNVTLADPLATLYVKVNSNAVRTESNPSDFDVTLSTGTNTITVYAKSQFGTKGTEYVFTINRRTPSSNAKLSALQVNAGGTDRLEGIFNTDTYTYSFRVDYNVTAVEILATPADSNASYVISPVNSNLRAGLNTYEVTVTAENGSTQKIYEINITRANDISDISAITIAGISFEFDPDVLSYSLGNVDFTTAALNFSVTLADSYATLYVKPHSSAVRTESSPSDFDVALVSGENTIQIYAKSQAGTEGKKYTFTVTRRVPSANANLSSLQVLANDFDMLTGSNTFDPSKTSYSVRVDNVITGVQILPTPADNKASVSIAPASFGLNLGANTFTITVTAEDGATKKIYMVTVTRANDVNTITSILIDNHDEFEYDAEESSYTLDDVAFSAKTLTFRVTLADESAKLYSKLNSGTAKLQSATDEFTITLANGQNTIRIYAISEFGTQGTVYEFSVTLLAANNDATLSNLSAVAGGAELLTGSNAFSAGVLEYNVRVNNNVTSVEISYTPSYAYSVVSVTPSATAGLSKGKNTFYVTVTAESGTAKTYALNIYRANDNNTITSIKVNGVELDISNPLLPIDGGTYPYTTTSVSISVTAADSSATVYGTGNKTLADGTQHFEVYAISEYGLLTGVTKEQVTVYTIEVTRIPVKTDNKLDSLNVTDGEGNILLFDNGVTFDPNRYSYTITLPVNSTITQVNINAVATTNSKTLSGDFGVQTLEVKENGTISEQFVLTVTAQNGSQQNYTINILKGTALSSDASIYSVSLKDAQNNEYMSFNPNVAKQADINIPYAVTGLTLTVTPTHEKAKVSGTTGFISVNAGSYTYVQFKVMAEDGTESLNYNFNIYRAAARTEKILSSLTVKNAADESVDFMSGIFDSATTTYNLRVDDVVSRVVVEAAVPENGSAIISPIQPYYDLVSGQTTTIIIIVQAENGTSAIYTLNIKRANNDNSISAITIGNETVPVSSFTQVGASYEYTVPDYIYSVTTVEIGAVLTNGTQSKASIVGAGIKNLTVGTTPYVIYAVAQDGTEGIHYIVRITRKPASNDATLKTLKVTTDTSVVLLDATGSINTLYSLIAGRDVSTVTIEAVKNHAGAKVTGDKGTLPVTGGTVNTFRIYVTAEDDETSMIYTINLDARDDDKTITNITSDVGTLNFNAEIVTYNLDTVPYATNKINFAAELGSEYAKLFVNSAAVNNIEAISYDLSVGLNTFVFRAQSEAGTDGTAYTITVTRTAPDTNNYLSSLQIKDNLGNVLSFEEGPFNKFVQTYTIILSPNYNAGYVVIAAIAENGTLPSGTGVKELSAVGGVISREFEVKVTAESGDVRTYKVNVIKSQVEESGDNTITDISLIGSGVEYLKSRFNPDTPVQDPITVPYEVNSVYLTLTAHPKATKTGEGIYNIAEGETITITFRVTAQNGTQGTLYSVDVTREMGSSDNQLAELWYEVNGERVELDPSFTSITINVTVDTPTITIGGTAPDKATVTGLGTYTLVDLTTQKVVTVKAQNGDIKTYVFNINKQSDDATISSIRLDGSEILAGFDTNHIYQITVPYSKTSVTIAATAASAKATINGAGSFNLAVGLNEYEVYAVAEAGNEGTRYTIKVTRQTADTNNNLSTLAVLDNATFLPLTLQPSFDASVTKYTIDLTEFPEVNEILINATAASSKVREIQGTGAHTLKAVQGESSEIFKVKVIAESGAEKTYEITVIRNIRPDDDITVNSLSFIGSDGVNYLGTGNDARVRFEQSTRAYTLTLPYAVGNATLSITNENGAVITGNQNYPLITNRTIEFRITSKSGLYSAGYVINVIKEQPGTDNTLKNIKVNGTTIEGFDPEVTSYEMIVALEEVGSVSVSAEANDPRAIVFGNLGNVPLSPGDNTVSIKVTAEDGTTRTYNLTIKRLSNDNALLSLGVQGYTIAPAFNANVFEYSLTVPYTVTTVTVTATANPRATVSGTGAKTLAIGENSFEVYATSEMGEQGATYIVNVTRIAPSSDNSLRSLSVCAGTNGKALILSPAFNPEITEYIIDLEGDESILSLTISAEANSASAIVGGTGYKVLKTTVDGMYNNVFDITVMAENMTTRTYTISVYRDVDLADDITITELSLLGSDGINYLGTGDAIERFMSDVHNYNIVVPFSVESVTLSIGTISATVYGAGQKLFGETNRVTFSARVVSQNGQVMSEIYLITVTRTLPAGDNALKGIKVNGVAIEGFSPETRNYEIDIPYLTTQKVIITAEPNSPTATILSGQGTFDLTEGRNVFSLLVKAENGDTTSYTVTINYMNNNSFLDRLSLVGSFDNYINDINSIAYPFTFIPDTYTYVVTVDKGIKVVNIKAQAQDQNRAAIIGLGNYQLNEDRTTIVVNVVAADNKTTTTYTLHVLKTVMPSSNTRLKNLSVQGYNLGFDPTNFDYSLDVDSTMSEIDVSAIPEDPNAKVSIVGSTKLDYGRNILIVQVEAEDGSTTFYQLHVNKKLEEDYFLTIMLILIFLLLLVIILYKLVATNKVKNVKKDLKGFKLSSTEEAVDLNNLGEEKKKWKS